MGSRHGWHRNIPAYAGKTKVYHADTRRCEEHPRVCGENAMSLPTIAKARGTSPRMRGKLFCHRIGLTFPRNIPAYAGKTSLRLLTSLRRQEHPRVCGENELAGLGCLGEEGTSPRMRGKLASLQDRINHSRNIPAYAGKTVIGLWRPPPGQEHPRVCGENEQLHRMACGGVGTSPRMRGKQGR